MTDDQWARLGFSALFNGPMLWFAAIYVRNMRRENLRTRDPESRRAYLVSFGFLAAIAAYVTLSVARIVSAAPPIDPLFRTVIFALYVVIYVVLILVTRSYRRETRVIRERR